MKELKIVLEPDENLTLFWNCVRFFPGSNCDSVKILEDCPKSNAISSEIALEFVPIIWQSWDDLRWKEQNLVVEPDENPTPFRLKLRSIFFQFQLG